MRLAYFLTAAKFNADKDGQEPSSVPMRPLKGVRRNPSTDQKKVRRLQQKTAAYEMEDLDAAWNAAYWSGRARENERIRDGIRNMLSLKNKRIVVTRGRKVPIGTTGICFYVGEGQWGWRVGFTTDSGETIWTNANNVEAVEDEKIVARKIAMPSSAESNVVVGDIFYNRWGYDQTNVDFYEVIRLTNRGVEIQPIESRTVSGDGFYDMVVAIPGSIRDYDVVTGIERSDTRKSKLCRLRDGRYIRLSRDHSAQKWDGRPLHETGPYGQR